MKTIFISIFQLGALPLLAQNVGIGTNVVNQAKLTVSGEAANSGNTVALFKSISGISLNGGTYPTIGLNSTGGKAISTGAGLTLELKTASFSPGFTLELNHSKAAGVSFTPGINVIKYDDYTQSGLYRSLQLLDNVSNGRLNVANEMYSRSNASVNLVPLGIIKYRASGFDAGSNAPTVISDNGGNIYDSRYLFNVTQGTSVGLDGYMNLVLNLNLVTKDYNDIIILGTPSYNNYNSASALSCSAEFLRQPAGVKDRIQIYYAAEDVTDAAEVFGTLIIYGVNRITF